VAPGSRPPAHRVEILHQFHQLLRILQLLPGDPAAVAVGCIRPMPHQGRAVTHQGRQAAMQTQHQGNHLPGGGIDATLSPALLEERAALADRLRSKAFSLTLLVASSPGFVVLPLTKDSAPLAIGPWPSFRRRRRQTGWVAAALSKEKP
jgi:hypothetical protein